MYEDIATQTYKVRKTANPTRFKELDSLRGFAAMYVMLFHLSRIAGYHLDFLNAGVTGVDLFFIISGYVIFMSLEKTKKSSDFIVSRLSRLMPSYIVMMAITIFVTFIWSAAQLPSLYVVASNLTMLQTWFRAPYIDESYWTLTVELLFYVGMLYLFAIKKLEKVIPIGAAVMVFFFVYYLVVSKYAPGSRLYIVPRYLFPITNHFQLFFAGIIFYKMRGLKTSWQTHLLLFVCFLITLFFYDKAGRAHFFVSFPVYTVSIIIYFVVFYLFVYNKLSFLNIPVLVFFGSISYGVYLLHQEFSIILHPYFVNVLGLNPVLSILILCFLIITISAFVTFRIERPVIKYIRNRYQGAVPVHRS